MQMRKKGKKVIRPAGDELMDYLKQCFDCLERLGYPIEKFLKEQEKES